jgi:hypothetical protein
VERYVSTPLVVEVLYRSLKAEVDSHNPAGQSSTEDLAGAVFNRGFRLP